MYENINTPLMKMQSVSQQNVVIALAASSLRRRMRFGAPFNYLLRSDKAALSGGAQGGFIVTRIK